MSSAGIDHHPVGHCTLCAMGIPGHVGASSTPRTVDVTEVRGADPVSAYLARRRDETSSARLVRRPPPLRR